MTSPSTVDAPSLPLSNTLFSKDRRSPRKSKEAISCPATKLRCSAPITSGGPEYLRYSKIRTTIAIGMENTLWVFAHDNERILNTRVVSRNAKSSPPRRNRHPSPTRLQGEDLALVEEESQATQGHKNVQQGAQRPLPLSMRLLPYPVGLLHRFDQAIVSQFVPAPASALLHPYQMLILKRLQRGLWKRGGRLFPFEDRASRVGGRNEPLAEPLTQLSFYPGVPLRRHPDRLIVESAQGLVHVTERPQVLFGDDRHLKG